MARSLRFILSLILFVVVGSTPFQAFALQETSKSVPTVIAWSPDGTMVAGAGKGLLRIWDAFTGATIIDLPGIKPDYITLSLSWSPDSTKIVAATDDNIVRIWNISSLNAVQGMLLNTIFYDFREDGFIETVDWSPDGTSIAVGKAVTNNRTLDILDATKYTLVRNFSLDWITNLSWDSTSTQIAFANQNNRAHILNINSSKNDYKAVGLSCAANNVDWSHDNHYLVMGCITGELGIWDLFTDKLVTTLTNTPPTSVQSVTWSPDNTLIASTHGDKYLRLWDSRTGELVQKIESTVNLYSASFSPDGSQIAYGSNDGTVKIISISVDVPTLPTATPT